MTVHAVYSKPAVDDQYYDEYNWTLDKVFDDRDDAIDFMPDLSNSTGLEAERAKNYVFTRIKFKTEEAVLENMTDRQKAKLS